jgi:hypothetical protein
MKRVSPSTDTVRFRLSSHGCEFGERFDSVKDASLLAPAKPVLRILDRGEAASPIMAAEK